MKDWIEQKRKEITAQREMMRANLHACDGALQILQELETKFATEDQPKEQE